jgi:hypothetical protein
MVVSSLLAQQVTEQVVTAAREAMAALPREAASGPRMVRLQFQAVRVALAARKPLEELGQLAEAVGLEQRAEQVALQAPVVMAGAHMAAAFTPQRGR